MPQQKEDRFLQKNIENDMLACNPHYKKAEPSFEDLCRKSQCERKIRQYRDYLWPHEWRDETPSAHLKEHLFYLGENIYQGC
jgi:hypothetical protein